MRSGRYDSCSGLRCAVEPRDRIDRGQQLSPPHPAADIAKRDTEPGMQGDRSTGGTKPATLETGAEIAVPLFITTGEKVKVDTRDGSYLGRVTG